jgi:hypothetical protein
MALGQAGVATVLGRLVVGFSAEGAAWVARFTVARLCEPDARAGDVCEVREAPNGTAGRCLRTIHPRRACAPAHHVLDGRASFEAESQAP